MSFADYDGLKAAVADWLNRADLVTQIPDFIRTGEVMLNRMLRSRYMIESTTISFTSGANRADMPADLIDILYIAKSTDATETLTKEPPEKMAKMLRLRQNTSGTPLYFAAIGDKLMIAPVPDASKTYAVDYYQEIPPLTAENDTNWLLEHYPDLYLYTSLYAASFFLREEEKVPILNQNMVQWVQDMITNNKTTTLEGVAYDEFKG